MRPVLIIAPYFAPQSHAAVYRAHKLAKYLPEHGWQPYVLTVDTNYIFNEDARLLAELPDAVEIRRVRYIEPTIRGMRMALGGSDRTFVAMKTRLARDLHTRPVPAGVGRNISGLLRQAGNASYERLRTRWLNAPDAFWTWERPAIRAAQTLVARHKIEVVISTGMPYTAHRVGRALQQYGATWLADFRDPMGHGTKMTSPSMPVLRRQHRIVRETLQHADVITTTARSYPLIFTDLFGAVAQRPMEWIPTGVDEALLPSESVPPAEPYLVYVGEIMPDQTDEFFLILGHALQRDHLGHRLVVIGHELMNRSRLGPMLERSRLLDRLTFIDHLSQAEVYRWLAGARAGVLAPGRTSYWWNLHAKLVDYVGLRKRVVALVPDPSEARSVLQETGLGIFLDGDADTATNTLVEFLNTRHPEVPPVETACNRFLARVQVEAFARLLSDSVS